MKDTNYSSPESISFFEKYVNELEWQKRIPAQALEAGLRPIHVRPSDGAILYLLANLARSNTIVEFGTLAGYSASWLVRALEPQGKLYTLDNDPIAQTLARKVLANCGREIVFLLGDAQDTIPKLPHQNVDFVFIDADKDNYHVYTKWALGAVRKNGLIVFDNTWLWGFTHQDPKNDWTKPTRDQWHGVRTSLELLRQNGCKIFQIPTMEGMTVAQMP